MERPGHRFQFIADRGDARLRLDRILTRRVTAVSRLTRSLAQRWIESAAVTVDGRPALRASVCVREGAVVEVQIPATATLRVRPAAEPLPLTVCYEDDDVIVIDKPAGMVVHPSYKQAAGTLLNAVLWHRRDRTGLQPGIVTRLDKDTSGLVLVALTTGAHAALQRSGSAIRKEYLALVRGEPRPPAGLIDRPIGRDPSDRRRMIVTAGGAASATRYEVISVHDSSPGPLSLVRCELLTGRTHQIRVHLASCGWPIAGDRMYGEADPRIGRQALHAWRLTFSHPTTDATIEMEAPLPPDLRALIDVPPAELRC
jgi:23S rRNA pseudouridine1911/1915/1917 synthase